MTAIEKVVQTAKAETGYLEKKTLNHLDSKTADAGDNNLTKYARDMDNLRAYHAKKQGLAWCAIFVDWVLTQCFGLDLAYKMIGKPIGKYGAGCTDSVKYYKKIGRFYTTPKVGDQIFFTKDGGKTSYHTGLVVGVSDTTVTTVEGNTSSAAGVVENGGAVGQKSYKLTFDKIYGYGRPNYSLAEEDDDMDVNKFAELMKEYRKTLQDNQAASWSQEARDWAVSTGLIVGNSTDDPNYMWEDLMNREQMAVLLYRFAQMMGKA